MAVLCESRALARSRRARLFAEIGIATNIAIPHAPAFPPIPSRLHRHLLVLQVRLRPSMPPSSSAKSTIIRFAGDTMDRAAQPLGRGHRSSGWRLANAVDYTFAEGAKSPGTGFWSLQPAPGPRLRGGRRRARAWSGALNNSGEMLALSIGDGREMDSVTYSDGGDWPVACGRLRYQRSRGATPSRRPERGELGGDADAGGRRAAADFAVTGTGPTVTTAAGS